MLPEGREMIDSKLLSPFHPNLIALKWNTGGDQDRRDTNRLNAARLTAGMMLLLWIGAGTSGAAGAGGAGAGGAG